MERIRTGLYEHKGWYLFAYIGGWEATKAGEADKEFTTLSEAEEFLNLKTQGC